MSNLEHAIENALVCIENGKSFKEFAEKENDLGNLNGISATAGEIWEIAEYVKYTYCNACDVKGGLTVAKCENCYHARACLNSLAENKGLNNTDDFGKTVFLSREETERSLEEINIEKNNN